MEAIQEGSNLSRTECGHVFHFPCLYRWTRKHANCPLCRHEFGTFEEEEEPEQSSYLDWVTANIPPIGLGQFLVNSSTGGYGRTVISDTIDRAFRTRIRDNVVEENMARPIDEFTGEIDSRDIDLVMRHVDNITREDAEAYLRCYGGDIVETILYLSYSKDMPIPPFRERDRPALSEPYVSRDTQYRSRNIRRNSVDFGYESC